MVNTSPQAFFAYPFSQPTLRESIQEAVPQLNSGKQVNIKTWEECNIGGKFVINTICDAIDEAELFFADLTGLNPNVMFELGYAIARNKRIWLILDNTYTEQNKMFEQLKILTTVAYVPCCNSQNIVSGFYENNPVEDMENTIFRTAIEPILTPGGYDSVLYLKSQHENQAALYMSNLLQERFPEKIIVDVPNKPAVQSLADYGDLVFGCNGLVCHFTNPKREGAYLETARHALICGMARGFEKPLLMLAEDEFPSPIDYRDYLKHYKNASEALGYLEEWLPRVERTLNPKQEATNESTSTTTQNDPNEVEGLHDPHVNDYHRAGDDDRAIAIELKPDYAEVYNRGAVDRNGRDADSVIVACNSALALYPDYAETYNTRGAAYRDKGDYDSAIEDHTEAIELKSDYAEAYYNRGIAYRYKGNYDYAILDYNKAIELKSDYAEAYNNRGVTYRDKGDYDGATKDYTKAIELKSDYAEAYYNRGIAYRYKGNYDRAIGDYNQAIELKPNFIEVYYNRGIAYAEKDDVDRAIKDYTQAIERKSGFAEAYYNRGIAYYSKDNFYDAIADFTKAIQLKPGDAFAYYNRGMAYRRGGGTFSQVIEDFTKTIRLNPNYAGAYYDRGYTYILRGNFDGAIEDYTQAIELKSDYAEAYNNRGTTYRNKGDYNRAIADYTKAIELKPDFAEPYYNRGETWLHLGEWENARLDLTVAARTGVNIIHGFRNEYGCVSDFEQRNGVKLPSDLAAMLTPQQ